jgi:hypothetical protein
LVDRDKARDELRKLRSVINYRYQEAELEFLPLFRSLTHDFIGLDLDVLLDVKVNHLGLVIQVEGSERRVPHQLSESQRFFLDIALRMAVAQYMSDASSPPMMLIDTPEGSLDAAYESRAGEMFARFVETGNQLIITANTNTSQLLLRLAQRCGQDRMTLARMTDWADLSEVQAAEEELFESAYSAIEESLRHN